MKIDYRLAILISFIWFSACSSMTGRLEPSVPTVETKIAAFEHGQALLSSGQYDAALNENQRILQEGRGAPDLALFNIGMISAHSGNPKKNYARALASFRSLVKDYPQSQMIEPAKTWIQVLEESQKLAEEKRALIKERESFVQEREKLKYIIEKSRQVDVEIEKRRRESLQK
jgi:hypothetical protein